MSASLFMMVPLFLDDIVLDVKHIMYLDPIKLHKFHFIYVHDLLKSED